MNIVVYCSSRADLGAEYEEIASALGQWVGSNGHTLVYGGVNAGLMHSVAQACHDAGAKVVGVVPEVFSYRTDEVCDEVILTADLNERKGKMIEIGDVFVVLPGGIGTIDEWVSTLSDIMVREKVDANADRPIVVVNHRGMYDGMIAQLATTNDSPFARGKRVDRSIAVADIEQLLQTLTHVSTKV